MASAEAEAPHGAARAMDAAQHEHLNPYSSIVVQKRTVNELKADVQGSQDSHQYNAEDESSAFTQFARTRQLLNSNTFTSMPNSSIVLPLPTPSPHEAPHPHQHQQQHERRGAKGRWRRWLQCACFAPPQTVEVRDEAATAARHAVSPAPTIRARRTLSRRVSNYAGARRTMSVRSTYSDADWFDALSRFDSAEMGTLEEVDEMLQQMPSALPTVQEPGPHVPDPPLLMAEKDFVFVPAPEETGYNGYWERDNERTTPYPQPIDVMLGSSKMAMKAHETIPGIWLKDGPEALILTAKPSSIPLGPLSRYVETFRKDGGLATWTMRRDIKVGRSSGQMFFTECGTLIFRVYAKGLWSNEPEYVTEEYNRLEDEGNTIVSRQCCKHIASGKVAVQYLVGDWREAPPPGY